MCRYLATALAVLASLASFAFAEEKAIQIPLKEVWAADMPGTRNISDLEPRGQRKYGPLMYAIQSRLMQSKQQWGSDEAGSGFAVAGKGIEALREANAVLVDKRKIEEPLPAGDIALIFYARQTGLYCHLERVSKDEDLIALKYRFIAHDTANISAHFAMIPLGKLARGKYEVKMIQLPVGKEYPERGPNLPPSRLDDERVRRIVSQPFTFEVK